MHDAKGRAAADAPLAALVRDQLVHDLGVCRACGGPRTVAFVGWRVDEDGGRLARLAVRCSCAHGTLDARVAGGAAVDAADHAALAAALQRLAWPDLLAWLAP